MAALPNGVASSSSSSNPAHRPKPSIGINGNTLEFAPWNVDFGVKVELPKTEVVIQAIKQALKQNPGVTALSLCCADPIEIICQLLPENPQLRSIEYYLPEASSFYINHDHRNQLATQGDTTPEYDNFDDKEKKRVQENIKKLESALKNARNIESLTLLTEINQGFLTFLLKMPNLKHLNVMNYYGSQIDKKKVLEALAQSKIQSLQFMIDNHDDLPLFLQAITRNTSITSLKLTWNDNNADFYGLGYDRHYSAENELVIKTTEAYCRMFKDNKTLQEVYFTTALQLWECGDRRHNEYSQHDDTCDLSSVYLPNNFKLICESLAQSSVTKLGFYLDLMFEANLKTILELLQKNKNISEIVWLGAHNCEARAEVLKAKREHPKYGDLIRKIEGTVAARRTNADMQKETKTLADNPFACLPVKPLTFTYGKRKKPEGGFEPETSQTQEKADEFSLTEVPMNTSDDSDIPVVKRPLKKAKL